MNIETIRATEVRQQAGAYYVRIQGMARQHGITLRREFDGHDGPETKYILLKNNYSVGGVGERLSRLQASARRAILFSSSKQPRGN